MTYENYKNLYENLEGVAEKWLWRNNLKSEVARKLAAHLSGNESKICLRAYVPVSGNCPGVHVTISIQELLEAPEKGVEELSEARYDFDNYWYMDLYQGERKLKVIKLFTDWEEFVKERDPF